MYVCMYVAILLQICELFFKNKAIKLITTVGMGDIEI